MGSIGAVVVASVAFVGSHFLLSHPLRGPLVRVVGEKGFLGIYSLVAFLTLGWMVMTYKRAPVSSPLWVAGDGIWAVVTVVMLIASILLMGSLIRNPALPTVGRPGAFPEAARGVFAVTRHPMMWAFALWGVCHIAVYPVTRNIVVALAMIVLALVVPHCRTRKRNGCCQTVGRTGRPRRAICHLRRSSPAGPGRPDLARTRFWVGLSSGSRRPGPICRSPGLRRVSGGGCSRDVVATT